MRKSLALACVIVVVSHGDCLNAWHWIDGADVDGVLRKVLSAIAVTINILPRVGCIEGQLVGAETDNGPKYFVQFPRLYGKATTQNPYNARNLLLALVLAMFRI